MSRGVNMSKSTSKIKVWVLSVRGLEDELEPVAAFSSDIAARNHIKSKGYASWSVQMLILDEPGADEEC